MKNRHTILMVRSVLLSLLTTYVVQGTIPSKNFYITKAFTTPSKVNLFGLDILDFYENNIADNFLYSAWADNSIAIPPAFGPSLNFRRGQVKQCKGNTKVHFDKIVTLFSPSPNGIVAEYSVTVNPTVPGNIVIGSNYITLDEPLPVNQFQLIRAVSFNNGDTWNVTRVDNTNGYPATVVDQHFLFDDFGNCWLISLTARPPLFAVSDFSIAVSTDGGVTFNLVQTFDYEIIDPNTNVGFDYTQIAFGGDGNGGFALYFTVDFIDQFGNSTPNIGYIPVSGLGNYGTPTLVQLTQFTNIWGEGVPRISKDGKIFILGVPFVPPFDLSPAQLIFNPGGLSNIKDGSFVGPLDVAVTNFCPPGPVGGCPINFTPNRGALPVIPRSLIYDDVLGRLYALYAEIQPPLSQDINIKVVFSDDNGQTWRGPIRINNCDKQNRAFQSMARDPKTGDFFFTWYDCRNSPTSVSGQYVGALVKQACLRKEYPILLKNTPKILEAKKLPTKANAESLKARLERNLRWKLNNRNTNK